MLPSLHDGYPLSLLEACARRTPVIATTVGSIPELFDGRACALLVRPRDTTDLSQAMAKILGRVRRRLFTALRRCRQAI